MKRALVTGAGGFIGGHLCAYLKDKGYHVTGIDIRAPKFRSLDDGWIDVFDIADASGEQLWHHISQADEVYALAADMGGMGYISKHNALILTNNLSIDVNTMSLAREANCVQRLFYASSACIYPVYAQESVNAPLAESMAYPAQPQDGYGWEKLMGEILAESYYKDYGLQTRVARYHNVYGECGAYKGGREKAPAALCRKIAEAKLKGFDYIEIWGDGEQTRSFMYITDCLEGTFKIAQHDSFIILNLGSEEEITINNLARLIAEIAGVSGIELRHIPGPVGVRGRSSDNRLIRETLNWAPSIGLREGMTKTYAWIEAQVARDLGV